MKMKCIQLAIKQVLTPLSLLYENKTLCYTCEKNFIIFFSCNQIYNTLMISPYILMVSFVNVSQSFLFASLHDLLDRV